MQYAQPAFLSQPTIVRIPTLLKELLDGDLLIPRFQRPFVWGSEQRERLLDSIYRRYPIGSILVWRTQTHKLACFEQIGGIAIPPSDRPDEKIHQYVLDGHQRLSTLLSTLGRGLIAARRAAEVPVQADSDEYDEYFGEIYFDLREPNFRQAGRRDKIEAFWLPCTSIFNPYAMRDFQAQLDRVFKQEGRKLAQRADDLAEQFKDYALPVTPLVSEDLEWVTESFKRVNSAGTTMSEVHMVHALSWGKDFDLDSKLDETIRRFNERGWSLTQEILLSTCKLITDIDPTRSRPKELKEKLQAQPNLLLRMERCLHAAIDFLEDLGIRGIKILPYTHQLTAIAFVASKCGDAIPDQRKGELGKWFWFTTYTAYLGTNAYLRKAKAELAAALEKGDSILPPEADHKIYALKSVHFHATRSRAFALRLAEAGAIDPRHPDADVSQTLAENGGDALVPLLTRRQAEGRESSPENRVLLKPTSAETMRRICVDNLREAMPLETRADLLRSHLITPEAEQALADRRYTDFLDLRRREINRRERSFVVDLGLIFEE